METTRNMNAVRRFVERGLNERNLAEFEHFFAAEVVCHEAGLEGLMALARACFEAIPDLRVVIDELKAEGDRTVLRWSAKGTWREERFVISGLATDRFAGGRSVEHWAQCGGKEQ